jgi:hypothetical protein
LAYCVQDRDKVFISYEVPGDSGRAFRNTEQLTIRDRKLVAAGVYFGWSLLHEAPAGGYIGPGIVARQSSGVHA